MNAPKKIKILFFLITVSAFWISCKKKVAQQAKPLKFLVTKGLDKDLIIDTK